ncbi:MAG: hypothetical protein Q4D41_09585 [Prevotellaceae bacterium]|nr:hypothetical protein [Prevotellaceae bacterium]
MSRNTNYFNSKGFKLMLRDYEEAEKAGVPIILSSEDFNDIAEYYYDNGDVKHALKVIDNTIKLYPGVIGPLLFRARIELLDNNDIDKAKYYIEQIEDKTDLDYYYIVAEIMMNQGKFDEADYYLEECYAPLEGDEKAYFEIDVATIFTEYNDIQKGTKWFKRCSNKDLIEYKELEAKITMASGDFQKSQTLFENLVEKDPFSSDYWSSLASSQFFNNNIEDSISSSEYSIAIDPSNTIALLNKANGLYGLGNYSEALKYYERCNSISKRDFNVEMLIASCYLSMEMFDKAEERFRKAECLVEPDDYRLVDMYKEWSYCLGRLGRVKEGIALLERTRDMDCDYDEILLYGGMLLMGCGYYDEGKDLLLQALCYTKNSPRTMHKISLTFYELGDMNLTYNLMTLLFKHYKDWHEGYGCLASCCYEMQKYDECLKYIKRAVKYSPEEAKQMLERLFPEGTDPKDYYKIMKNMLKNK